MEMKETRYISHPSTKNPRFLFWKKETETPLGVSSSSAFVLLLVQHEANWICPPIRSTRSLAKPQEKMSHWSSCSYFTSRFQLPTTACFFGTSLRCYYLGPQTRCSFFKTVVQSIIVCWRKLVSRILLITDQMFILNVFTSLKNTLLCGFLVGLTLVLLNKVRTVSCISNVINYISVVSFNIIRCSVYFSWVVDFSKLGFRIK